MPGPAQLISDAIVLSGWSWEVSNVPERLALVLARLGARVLYCENPASRRSGSGPVEVAPRVLRMRPVILGQRLNAIPGLASIQSRSVAVQIMGASRELALHDPVVFFPYMDRMLEVCTQLRHRGLRLVHFCIDHPQPHLGEHVSLAAHTLVIPKAPFHQLRADWGDRIVHLPQIGLAHDEWWPNPAGGAQSLHLAAIPKPRLVYAGVLQPRINMGLLDAFLRACPSYQFLYFRGGTEIDLPNAHALPWMDRAELAKLVAGCDAGFMPYDCRSEHAFHCVPLKLLDYYAMGMPVVATPIISLWDAADLAYLGETVEELRRGVERALKERGDDPRRADRVAVARRHTIESIAARLAADLGLMMAATSPVRSGT